jgi:hypothetical protein
LTLTGVAVEKLLRAKLSWAAHVPILSGRVLCLARTPFLQLRWPARQDRFQMFRLLLPIRSEVEKVLHWMPEILFAAEIAFRGLH